MARPFTQLVVGGGYSTPAGTTAEPGVDIQGVGAWSRYFSPRTDAFRQFQYIVNISNDIDIGPGAGDHQYTDRN